MSDCRLWVKAYDKLLTELEAARTQIAELTRERDEARELALKGICHDAVGDEWGHFPCPYKDRAEAAERERDALRELAADRLRLLGKMLNLKEQYRAERDELRERVESAEAALWRLDADGDSDMGRALARAHFAKHGA